MRRKLEWRGAQHRDCNIETANGSYADEGNKRKRNADANPERYQNDDRTQPD